MVIQAPLLALMAFGIFVSASERAWIGGASRVNVRSGPGTEYPSSSVAAEGEETVIEERAIQDWVLVSFPDGRKGYVRTRFLSSTATATGTKPTSALKAPPPKPAVTPQATPATSEKDAQLAEARKMKEALETKNQELERDLQAYRQKLQELSNAGQGRDESSTETSGLEPKHRSPTLLEIRALRTQLNRLDRTLRVFEKNINQDAAEGEDLPMGSIRDHLSTTILGIGILMVGCVLGARYIRWKDKMERNRLHF
jgi:uncharacterized protein YraI